MTRVPPARPASTGRHPILSAIILLTVLLIIPSTRPVIVGWAGDALQITGQALAFLAGGLLAALVLLNGTARRR